MGFSCTHQPDTAWCQGRWVAEHTIGVLTSAAHAMLHDAGLPKSLWAEAVATVTHVHIRTPTKALGGRLPYEMPYRTKLDVSHLRTFRVPCTIVELSELVKKLDDQLMMCFFIGYKYETGGYWVWDPKRQVVVESKGLKFFLRMACPHPLSAKLGCCRMTTDHSSNHLPSRPMKCRHQ